MRKLGIIGCGNMGEALLSGIIKSHKDWEIYICEKNKERLESLREKYGGIFIENAENLIEKVDFIILAVKPQDLETLKYSLEKLKSGKILISILAGVKVNTLRSYVGSDISIIRAMPNIAAVISESITAIYCSEKEKNLAEEIFSSIGEVIFVDREDLIDAATAISGSGVAFVLKVIEGFLDTAILLGFKKEDALKLAVQTVLGITKLLSLRKEHPTILKEKITSPGGTTASGLFVLEKEGFKGILMEAIVETFEKAKRLSR